MGAIDQAEFHFSEGAGLAVGIMVGFLVFSVALDLTWRQLYRVSKHAKAPGVGLLAQFLVLPAVAFLVGTRMVDTPSVALGLPLVACCPGGGLSNYLTGVARGNVATSISMTALSTLICVVLTPLVFGFWASRNPVTSDALRAVDVDLTHLLLMLLIMLVVPVAGGTFLRARHPRAADAIRPMVRRTAVLVFGTVVALVLGANLGSVLDYSAVALAPVLVTFTVATILGWALARLWDLSIGDRRAVVLEVGVQNVALSIAMAVAFFPQLAGVAVTSALWGIVHLVLGPTLALGFRRAG